MSEHNVFLFAAIQVRYRTRASYKILDMKMITKKGSSSAAAIYSLIHYYSSYTSINTKANYKCYKNNFQEEINKKILLEGRLNERTTTTSNNRNNNNLDLLMGDQADSRNKRSPLGKTISTDTAKIVATTTASTTTLEDDSGESYDISNLLGALPNEDKAAAGQTSSLVALNKSSNNKQNATSSNYYSGRNRYHACGAMMGSSSTHLADSNAKPTCTNPKFHLASGR